MTETRDAATPKETREAVLRGQARGYTQVRHVFVQRESGDGSPGSRASTLAHLVHNRKHRALLAYLLLLGASHTLRGRETRGEPPLEAGVWVRALTSGERSAPTWSPSTLSRTWTDLQGMGLLRRERRDRLVQVLPRREDGGADYEEPGGRKGYEDWYFALPDTFWTDDWFGRLSLPALAAMLIIAKETNDTTEVRLTHQQFEDWYGLHRRTAGNGLRELEKLGLLHVRKEVVKAALSGTGMTVHHHYSLKGDFGYLARKAMQKRARTEAVGRAAAATSPTRKKPVKPQRSKKRKSNE